MLTPSTEPRSHPRVINGTVKPYLLRLKDGRRAGRDVGDRAARGTRLELELRWMDERRIVVHSKVGALHQRWDVAN